MSCLHESYMELGKTENLAIIVFETHIRCRKLDLNSVLSVSGSICESEMKFAYHGFVDFLLLYSW